MKVGEGKAIHVPLVVVSVFPTTRLPLMAGGAVLTGALVGVIVLLVAGEEEITPFTAVT